MASKNYRGVLGIGLFLYLLVSSVFGVTNGLSYDYYFTSECLPSPPEPQYGGGIVVNPELNDGLNGWVSYTGNAKLEQRKSEDGNNYIVAFDRNGWNDSLSQKFDFQDGTLYILSAWLRVSDGNSTVAATFQDGHGNSTHAGSVVARSGCWSMLKGGITASASGAMHLLFLNEQNTTVDIWADSISLQPFTQSEWTSHQIQSLETVRKSKVRFQAVDAQDRPLAGVNISMQQLKNEFPLGCVILGHILEDQAYQDWFTSRFKYTVFGNEMKWYATEQSPGKEDYSIADAMLQLAKNHSITVRGHNIFWDNPQMTPSWVTALSPADLKAASARRMQSVVERYKGQVIHWDVINENLHYHYFEKTLNITTADIFAKSYEIDPNAIPFLNEFNTLEVQNDNSGSPSNYMEKIKEIRSDGYDGPLGIGLQGHFDIPDLAYVRAALDTLASAKLPIWITELDISGKIADQATHLNKIIRELHAHPAVQGIVLWTAWGRPNKCTEMCLTDNNFNNIPAGDVVDKFMAEMKAEDSNVVTTDADGYFETTLYYGDYEARINGEAGSLSPSVNFTVAATTNSSAVLDVKLSIS